jgi:uncharacterized surface protein with fasciclin (FAS1) repeats
MQDMQKTRIGFLSFVVAAAVAVTVGLAGPSFAKGGAGGGGGGAGGGSAKTPPAKAKTVLDEIQADSSLSKFAAAVKAADLESALKGANITVLAPNDAAFDKAGAKWTDLAKDKAKAKAVLAGHILSGKLKQADIAKQTKLSGQGGVTHEVKLGDDKQPTIDGAKIVTQDKEGSNGLYHVIDTLLLPPEKK